MIDSGEKIEEYRKYKLYWCKRFLNRPFNCITYITNDDDFRNVYISCNDNNYTHVLFYYGYTKTTMMFEIVDILYGFGNPKWGAPEDQKVFIIELGKRIE